MVQLLVVPFDMDNVYIVFQDLFQMSVEIFEFFSTSPSVIYTAIGLIYPQIFATIFFAVLTSKMEYGPHYFNYASWFIGMGYLLLYDHYHLLALLLLVIFSYILFMVVQCWKIFTDSHCQVSSIYGFLSIAAFIYLEIHEGVGYFQWKYHRYMLIMAMIKIFSITILLSSDRPLPAFCHYMGYMFCPATLLLGPFISINNYNYLYLNYKKYVWNSLRIKRIAVYTLQTVVYYMIADFADNYFTDRSNKYISGMLRYISFRFQYYSYGYATGALLTAAGFKNINKSTWRYQNVSIKAVEWPRCFVQFWMGLDISTYFFLFENGYVLIPNYLALTFCASTYILLLTEVPNIPAAAFKLSVIIFSYIFYEFREVLSKFMSACIRTEKCTEGDCDHIYTTYSFRTITLNTIFTIVVILLMPYLFTLIDDKAYANNINTVQRLGEFYYVGHHFLLMLCIMTSLLNIYYDTDSDDDEDDED